MVGQVFGSCIFWFFDLTFESHPKTLSMFLLSRELLNSSFSQDVGAFVVVTNCERAGDLNLHMWKLIPVSISILYTSICPGFASKARMPQIEKVHASS